MARTRPSPRDRPVTSRLPARQGGSQGAGTKGARCGSPLRVARATVTSGSPAGNRRKAKDTLISQRQPAFSSRQQSTGSRRRRDARAALQAARSDATATKGVRQRSSRKAASAAPRGCCRSDAGRCKATTREGASARGATPLVWNRARKDSIQTSPVDVLWRKLSSALHTPARRRSERGKAGRRARGESRGRGRRGSYVRAVCPCIVRIGLQKSAGGVGPRTSVAPGACGPSSRKRRENLPGRRRAPVRSGEAAGRCGALRASARGVT